MAKTKSIFDLERRIDLVESYMSFETELKSMKMAANTAYGSSILQYLNRCFRIWPYREGCMTINDFLDNKGINLEDQAERKYSDEEKILFSFELYYNAMMWGIECDSDVFERKFDHKYIPVDDYIYPILENVEYILEKCDYCIRKIKKKGCDQYFITKRNITVDCAVIAEPKLKEALLGYYDLRNTKDEEYKRATFRKLSNYLERKYKANEFNGTECKGIYDSASFLFNNLNLRHGDDKQLVLPKRERMKLYDDLFRMCLFLIQYSDVKQCKNHADKYRPRREEKP